MTELVDAAVRPAVAAGSPSRRVARGVVVAVVAGVAALALIGWFVAAQVSLSSVRIVYDAAPVRCEGANVGLYAADGGDGAAGEVPFDDRFLSPVVDVTEGMLCAIRLHIVNTSWMEVEVTTVGVPMMGSEMSTPLRALHVNPNGQTRLPDTVEGSAEFLIEGGITVPVGGSQPLLVVIDASGVRDGLGQCVALGPLSPYVVVQLADISRHVASADEDGIWYRRGSAAECDF